MSTPENINREMAIQVLRALKDLGLAVADVDLPKVAGAAEEAFVAAGVMTTATYAECLKAAYDAAKKAASPAPEPEELEPWPTNLAIAACLRVMADDLSNGTAEGFSPTSAPMNALDESDPRSPHTEEGFRAWLDYFGGLASEAIDDAVAKVRREGGLDADEDGPTVDMATPETASTDAVSLKAISYTLERAQLDADFGYLLGPGTQAFALLCEAEAKLRGMTVAEVTAGRSKSHARSPRRYLSASEHEERR